MNLTTAEFFAEEPLSDVEARALGCLVEKQLTTPESYPLTLNALQLACNQKTSREPVMTLEVSALAPALRQLEQRGLVAMQMGGRADRWEQRLDKQLQLTPPQTALLALLLLRGGQTLAELLSRSARLYRFDDVEEVRHQLERMAAREWVTVLDKQPGQREERYLHRLQSPADLAELAAAAGSGKASAEPSGSERLVTLEARLQELEERLALLERRL